MSERKKATYIIIGDEDCSVKVRKPKEIQVVVRMPKKLHERIRQQKINQIYDILNPKTYH